MEFKGSRTEANLMAAFAGESQARNRYTFFASQAKKEGFQAISKIFLGCFAQAVVSKSSNDLSLITGIPFSFAILRAEYILSSTPLIILNLHYDR